MPCFALLHFKHNISKVVGPEGARARFPFVKLNDAAFTITSLVTFIHAQFNYSYPQKPQKGRPILKRTRPSGDESNCIP